MKDNSKQNLETENYILEPHITRALCRFHYHLKLKKYQKNDTKGIRQFDNLMQIENAKLNNELEALLRTALIETAAEYIKVEFED